MKQILIISLIIILSINSFAQDVGARVSLADASGKKYTGTIEAIYNGKYKIKYDGYDFQAWLTSNQFTVIGAANNYQNQQTTQQQNGNWQVGDKVQVKTYSMAKWENATILRVLTDRTPTMYKATLDNAAGYADATPLLAGNQVRSINAKPAINFSIKSRVDVTLDDGRPKGRATVIEIKSNGRYKVKYDGCKDYWDEDVDWSQLKTAAVVSSNDPDITAVIGKWAMFVYSYPNTVTIGNNVYREYGTGAKAPPLQINANGTYVWYDEYNKPPVKANWFTHAKIDGLTTGTESVNGIIIKDSYNIFWKIYKDRQDHIEARKMCSGETEGGSRIK